MTVVNGQVSVGANVSPTVAKKMAYLRAAPVASLFVGNNHLLNDWSRIDIAADGTWTADVPVLPAGYAYRFEEVLDGRVGEHARIVTIPATGPVNYSALVDAIAPTDQYWSQPPWVALAQTSLDAATATINALASTYVTLTAAAKNPDLLVVGALTGDPLTSAQVVWPNGQPGTLFIDSRHATGAVNAYHITYGSPVTKTFTQPAITRSATGAATNVPQIVVS